MRNSGQLNHGCGRSPLVLRKSQNVAMKTRNSRDRRIRGAVVMNSELRKSVMEAIAATKRGNARIVYGLFLVAAYPRDDPESQQKTAETEGRVRKKV
jgi:hypothetical protein